MAPPTTDRFRIATKARPRRLLIFKSAVAHSELVVQKQYCTTKLFRAREAHNNYVLNSQQSPKVYRCFQQQSRGSCPAGNTVLRLIEKEERITNSSVVGDNKTILLTTTTTNFWDSEKFCSLRSSETVGIITCQNMTVGKWKVGDMVRVASRTWAG